MNQEKKDPLEGLNPQQLKAVKHFTGPLLILAGAGTGKTRVITHRIAYLIEGLGVQPSQILALTFTNKAAGEMRERAAALIGDNARGAMLSTFHSFCNYMLRRDIGRLGGWRDGYSIYDESDARSCVRELLKSMCLPASGPFAPARICEIISRSKNFRSSPADYVPSHDPLFDSIIKIAEGYERRLVENNALDFDNLILKALDLLENHDDVRHGYRQRFQFLLVDEYQDTNRVQYELLQKLSPADGNVTVVGDLDQSIYGWRGADVGNMIAFEQDFEDVEVVPLEQNYRSKQRILDAANSLIRHNAGIHEKRLWSELGEGDPVYFHMPMDERDEASFVSAEIDYLLGEGYRLDNIAVLFRTRAQSRVFEEKFMRDGVPYTLIGATEFYHRKEIKDIVAFLRVIENPQDFVSFARIANEPRRGIGKKGLSLIDETVRTAGSLFDIIKDEKSMPKDFPKKAVPFLQLLNKYHVERTEYSLPMLVEEVTTKTGYREMLEKSDREEGVSRTENIDEFISMASEYESDTARPTLEGFLSHVALVSDVDVRDTGDERVRMMTFHSAKGLEFPVVFFTGFEEGLLPHASSMESRAELEEERRLCYVGITRARELLFASACRSRLMHGSVVHNNVSRFFTEIGQEHFKIVAGPRGAAAGAESFFGAEPDFERGPDDKFSFERNKSRRKRPLSWSEDTSTSVTDYDIGFYEKQAAKRKSQKQISPADDDVYIYSDESDFGERREPVRAAPRTADGLKTGDRVEHEVFGIGTVVSLSKNEICIAFRGRGVVKLSPKFAPIKKM
jgi:DNA helicase II / ATP-dependent DNA helicase PcrA